jgi:ubiquinone/menaquinone biosynthesis C-methylase UbiE
MAVNSGRSLSMTKDLGICSGLEALQRTVGPLANSVVVDIGSGDGSLARSLAEAGAEVSGFDPLGPVQPWTEVAAGRYRLVREGAEAMPLADGSVDLVLFIYSLHHIPPEILPSVLAEARRVLRPGGHLYVAEPLAQGPLQEVSALYHDETMVRQRAADILATVTPPLFRQRRTIFYSNRRVHKSFDEYADRMAANMRFNDYTEPQLRAPAVRERFDAVAAQTGGIFDQPVRIDLMQP